MPIALHPGSLFAGRYQIRHLIAEGAMGAIYEVVQLGTGRRRALKVMHAHVLHSPELRDRFALEARVAGDIQSEFIVEVIDAGVDPTTQMPFLVMELLDGEELGKRLDRLGRFTPEEVVTYLRQVAVALDKTHKAGIIHRDLKPANLFLTQRDDGSPRIKILDFGVAKVIAEGASGAAATQSIGTPLYMPPEQFRVGAKLGPAADIYALGMIVYTLLVGEAYWRSEAKLAGEMIAFAMVAIKGPVEPAVQRAAARGVALPAGFDAWFMKATAVNPAERFARATDAVSALAEVFGPAPPRLGSIPSFVQLPATQGSSPAGPGTALTPAGTAATELFSPQTKASTKIATPFFILAAATVLAGVLGGFYFLRTRGIAPAQVASSEPAAPAATQAASAVVPPAPPVPGSASATPASAPASLKMSSPILPSASAAPVVRSAPLVKPAPPGSIRSPVPHPPPTNTESTQPYTPD